MRYFVGWAACHIILFVLVRFEKQYIPWLNLSAHQDTTSPLVSLVRCLVASRHLEHHQRIAVTPQLQRLVDEVIPKLVFSTVPTTDAMQALLILSLWAPVSDSPQSNIRDGRLLVASAISLGMNMRLSQATVSRFTERVAFIFNNF
jgi:hypothetical protein